MISNSTCWCDTQTRGCQPIQESCESVRIVRANRGASSMRNTPQGPGFRGWRYTVLQSFFQDQAAIRTWVMNENAAGRLCKSGWHRRSAAVLRQHRQASPQCANNFQGFLKSNFRHVGRRRDASRCLEFPAESRSLQLMDIGQFRRARRLM